jgi:hypothetical protein
MDKVNYFLLKGAWVSDALRVSAGDTLFACDAWSGPEFLVQSSGMQAVVRVECPIDLRPRPLLPTQAASAFRATLAKSPNPTGHHHVFLVKATPAAPSLATSSPSSQHRS